ncbi:hypothetical protein H8356DRAFT_1326346 [Neocallimastix lanati (nom. inval.)]|nr:hypothetical protein H8356DRAFT_1326346 [Neocallimastix sp. JGI-2020a]
MYFIEYIDNQNLNSIEKDVSTGNNNQCEEEEKIMIFQMIRMIRIKKQKILRKIYRLIYN